MTGAAFLESIDHPLSFWEYLLTISNYEKGLAAEEVFDLLDEDVAAHVGDGFG